MGFIVSVVACRNSQSSRTVHHVIPFVISGSAGRQTFDQRLSTGTAGADVVVSAFRDECRFQSVSARRSPVKICHGAIRKADRSVIAEQAKTGCLEMEQEAVRQPVYEDLVIRRGERRRRVNSGSRAAVDAMKAQQPPQ